MTVSVHYVHALDTQKRMVDACTMHSKGLLATAATAVAGKLQAV